MSAADGDAPAPDRGGGSIAAARHTAQASEAHDPPAMTFADGDPEQSARCDALVERACVRDPKVKALQRALAALGVTTPVSCVHCPEGEGGEVPAAGGYMPQNRQVVLCQQWAVAQPTEVSST